MTGRYRQIRTRRTASSAAVLLLGSLLLAVPAAGALTSGTSTGPGHIELGGVTRPVAPPTTPVENTGAAGTPPTAGSRRLVIDALGVAADLETVGLAADGTVAPPTDVARAGWYAGSSRPGDKGPAVIVGHLDSADGPAVFARLAELEVGDVVTVENGSETALSFAVSTVARHPKQSFPSGAVYGASPDAELRLITCGGRYDRDSGYADNVVVFATAVTG